MRTASAVLVVLLCHLLLLPDRAHGAPPGAASLERAALANHPELAIPPPLRPWVGWALHDQERSLCPPLLGEGDEGHRCAWPTALALSLDGRGGRFSLRYRMFHRGFVLLPGDDKAWPQEVRVDGRPAVVLSGDDEGTLSDAASDDARPVVLLEPGDHHVEGFFRFSELPESLAVPKDVGLLSLTLRGERVPLPVRDDEGRVFLERPETEREEDVLEVTVFRKVTDEVPLELTTHIELRVAGRGREVLLRRPLPPGFVPRRLDSPLPARLLPDGRLRVQARAGTFTLTLDAHRDAASGPAEELPLPKADAKADADPWAPGEVWVFEARPSLRVVQVEGVAAVDPQQTRLPAAWRRLPSYAVNPGEVMRLSPQRRGEPAAPDQVQLQRQLWLDFDGGGYTARDQLSGTVRRLLRLEVDAPLELGSASVDGQDQLVTRGLPETGGKSGVEIRQGRLALEADLRIARRGPALPASGWRVDLQDAQLTVNLPPGWRLLHLSGADDVPETWVRRWSLLDLFLVLVGAMALGRLYGRRWGALGLLGLLLLLPEAGAPRWIFAPVLAAAALLRLLPEGRARTLLRGALLVSQVLLAVAAATFAAQHVRQGLYPALARDEVDSSSFVLATKHAPTGGAVSEPPQEQALPDVKEMEQERRRAPRAQAPSPVPKKGAKRDEAKQEAQRADEDGADLDLPAGGLVGTGRGGGGTGESTVTLDALSSRSQSLSYGGKAKPKAQQSWAQRVDPSAAVQTGPGRPGWSWTAVPVRISGPVTQGQELRLYLLSPGTNLLLALLRVGLLVLLVLRLLLLDPGPRVPEALRRLLLGLLPLALLLAPGAARAEEPPLPGLLTELRDRLVKPPLCHPRCAESPALLLDASGRALRLRLTVAAAAPTAVPLPGSAEQWRPVEVLVDGRPAGALRTEGDHLYVQVGPGNHEVTLSGPLPDRDTVQLGLPLKPHRVEARLSGWRLDGVHEDGQVDEDLQLTREQRDPPRGSEAQAREEAGAAEVLPPFLRVERELQIGLQWQVVTRVVRLTPPTGAAVLEVPLLPGESVTTAEVRVKEGKALVNLPPGQGSLEWRSLLEERSPLTLTAGRGGPYTELWRLDLGPIWHAELSGLAPVHAQEAAGLRRPEWRPWPGQQVQLQLTRLPGAAGQTLTLDRSALTLRPGQRVTEGTLELSLRASRGGQHGLLLPRALQVQEVTIDGLGQPLQREGDRLLIPVKPGAQAVKVQFRHEGGIGPRYRSPALSLGAPSVNAHTTVQLGEGSRWVLLCAGPRLGPAVLFWSEVLLLGLVALLLQRARFVPLRAADWLLLGLGLTPLPLWLSAVVAGFLLALGLRRERPELPRRWFNLRQAGLLLWGVLAGVILIAAVHEGLLGQPDMQIRGNGSSLQALRWFADRASGPLPQVLVISAPLWVYRLAMLLWALWLAQALLRWLRWGYGALGEGGLWRGKAPTAPEPPAAA